MSLSYVLTEAAEADLRGIVRYTRSRWGDAQVRRYVGELERGIARLADREGGGRDMGALYPGLLMDHCGHHYVFCLPQPDAPSLIVGIFHERMDLLARLADRLTREPPR